MSKQSWIEGGGCGECVEYTGTLRRSSQLPIGMALLPGERVRVHEAPRRYRDGCWTGAAEWRRRVIHSDDELFVVNKPSRLPTQAHESNAVECVGGCAEAELGLPPGSLRIAHRLDASTSGVLLLGRTPAAVGPARLVTTSTLIAM